LADLLSVNLPRHDNVQTSLTLSIWLDLRLWTVITKKVDISTEKVDISTEKIDISTEKVDILRNDTVQ